MSEFDQLLERLHATVLERRKAGLYPAHLELDLDQHFERIVSQHPAGTSLLRQRMEEVRRASQVTGERIIFDSNVPGGALLHKTAGRMVSRQTEGILAQLRWFAGSVREALELVVDGLAEIEPSGGGSDRVDLTARLDAVMEQLARYERAGEAAGPEVREIFSRLEEIEAEVREARFRPAYSRAAFLERFAGPRATVMETLRPLVQHLAGQVPVLDLGCGRGEMLQLLASAGFDATGVDEDPELAAVARESGLPVTVARPLRYLESVPDASLGGIFAGYLAERLSPRQLALLAVEAGAKLRPGGRFVAQAHNPASAEAMAGPWAVDPENTRPVHPEYLAFLFEQAGFATVETSWGPAADPAPPAEYATIAIR